MNDSNNYSLADGVYPKELIEKECKIQKLVNQSQILQRQCGKNTLCLKLLEQLSKERVEYDNLILKHFESRL